MSALLFGQLHARAEAKTKLATAPATPPCPSLSLPLLLSLSLPVHLELGFGSHQIGQPLLVSLLTSRTPVAASAAEFSTPFRPFLGWKMQITSERKCCRLLKNRNVTESLGK